MSSSFDMAALAVENSVIVMELLIPDLNFQPSGHIMNARSTAPWGLLKIINLYHKRYGSNYFLFGNEIK